MTSGVGKKMRSYSELERLSTFADRFRYLALQGQVGASTFGYERWINQQFYRSREWRRTRDLVIIRDNGCDLGVEGYEIHDQILVHHINPLTADDIENVSAALFDLENLICTTHRTHNAIHYGDESLLPRAHAPRRPGDTQLWSRRS